MMSNEQMRALLNQKQFQLRPEPRCLDYSGAEWRVAGFVRIRMPAIMTPRILTNPATQKHITLSQAKDKALRTSLLKWLRRMRLPRTPL